MRDYSKQMTLELCGFIRGVKKKNRNKYKTFVIFCRIFFISYLSAHIHFPLLFRVTVELNFASQPGEGAYISHMLEQNWFIVVFSDQL